MNNFVKNRKGFALLYALLLSGAVLSVGVILMNIITKQLIYSSVSRSSETAYYYLANSGRECLTNATKGINGNAFYSLIDVLPNGDYVVQFNSEVSINCLGTNVILTTGDVNAEYPTYASQPATADSGNFDLNAQFNACRIASESAVCDPTTLIGRNTFILRANGYGKGGDRSAFRSAFYVK